MGVPPALRQREPTRRRFVSRGARRAAVEHIESLGAREDPVLAAQDARVMELVSQLAFPADFATSSEISRP